MNDKTPLEDWARLHSSLGDARLVPSAINRLLHASSSQEATDAYWELDNRVVVQGRLFNSAVPTASEVTLAICAGKYTSYALPEALDLLVELAYGESYEWEVVLGNCDLGP